MSRLKSELKNLVWDYAADYRDNSNPLHHYLRRYKKSKDKFFEKILEYSCDIQQDISRYSLEKEVNELFSNEVNSLNYCTEIDNYIYEIETDEIFNEMILGTNDSYLSALIINLNSSDWIKKGLDYLSLSDNKCPFCQKIIPIDFGLEINKIFNNTYDKKINSIKEKLTSYQFKCDNIFNVLKQINLDERFFDKDNFYKLTSELKKEIHNNISLIKEKITTPSKCLELTKTNYLICEINKIINNINLKIKEYNLRLSNRENYKKELEVKFWSMLKNGLVSYFNSYKLEVIELENKIKNYNAELDSIISDIDENKKIIADNLARVINIDASIENINNTLLKIGITGFHLEKVHESSDSYKLVREDGLENDVYKSLSEGEKTLIVFLYFILPNERLKPPALAGQL
nr:AAA family ATPase [Photorhabdus sp. CRCIA-P01]